MDSVYFWGRIKNKYRETDVLNAIVKFAEEKNLFFEWKDANTVCVDFGIESEGFWFRVKDRELSRQAIKHEVDDERKCILIYDLFYELKKFFSKYEVDDEFGIWMEYCYRKNPVQIVLRELTAEEKEIFDHIEWKGCKNYQIYLAIIALFLWNKDDVIDEVPGKWEYMIQHISRKEWRQQGLWVLGVQEAWISKCMMYKGKRIADEGQDKKGLQTAMGVAEFSLQEALMGVWAGTVGKKQRDIVNFYAYEDSKRKKENGHGIEGDPFLMYRFVLSSLEYLGFEIMEQPQFPEKKIEARQYDYYEIV